jgi:hypothetical protein
MSEPKFTREDWIYLWKTEGGNMSWARWCKINDLPEKNPGFLEEAKRAGVCQKGILGAQKQLVNNSNP